MVQVGRIFLINSIPFYSDGEYVKNFYDEAEALLIEAKKEDVKKKRIIKKVITTYEEVDQN